MTILSDESGSTCNCSISVRKATTLPLNSGGMESCTVEGSIGSASLDAEIVVDRGGDALGRGEVCVAQREPYVGQSIEREFDLALDERPVGDAADGGDAADDLGGFALGLETVDGDRALRHRIDVAVGAEQGGDQQGPALQVLGVAERRTTVTSIRVPWVPNGGRLPVTITAADVAGADRRAADVDAHALEHRLQRLLGEGDVVQGVAGAVEADDEAVADELVLAARLRYWRGP